MRGELAPDCLSAGLPDWQIWIEARRSEFHRAAALVDLSADRADIEGALDLLSEHPPAQGVLCHGDFADDNILLGTKGEVRAMIDWNNCLACDPAYDLAYCYTWPRRIDCLRELIRGYTPGDAEEFRIRIRAHLILLAVYFIVWCHDRNSTDGARLFAEILSEATRANSMQLKGKPRRPQSSVP